MNIIDYTDALLTLNKTPEDISALEEAQIQYLTGMATAAIISYCGYDPRDDPDQDCSVLGFVAGRMLMRWWPQVVDQTTGIDTESFDTISTKYSPDTGLGSMDKMILDRYKTISIA